MRTHAGVRRGRGDSHDSKPSRQMTNDKGAQERLAALRRGVARCRPCSLWRRATHTVPGEGIAGTDHGGGGGAGQQEDLCGRPFIGRGRLLLAQLLAHAGLRRENVYTIRRIVADSVRNAAR
jgi:uracil-DNA glycosylase